MTTLDAAYVRNWMDKTGIPFSELATRWTDKELMDWFLSLYDRPGSGMWTLRASIGDDGKWDCQVEAPPEAK